ncbi:MAG: class I SAM-dependent rRNA methyltransferase [Alphaproteobacteria bacterium]|uniref:Class I SAM-dependent rRNA methyltransferase n=1 Tax=Candidatus Nitrobium versatile TaxID=2884831 RepID=A0A953M1V5_9BACT|nr:class I SAM-dependent rRNA methyltransferase [Candidatus Nitrobium versatile]
MRAGEMGRVSLKRSHRVLAGHPWIFSNEMSESPKRFKSGSLVEVYDRQNSFLGIGYINPSSLIAIRLLTRKREPIDDGFFRRRIGNALHHRERFLGSVDSCRLVFSEGDFLPGLIVDRYGSCLSVQFLTLGMEGFRDTVLEILDEMLVPSVIVVKNDSQSRMLEGLPLLKEVIKGALDELPVIREGEILLEVDPLSGQKTGFFLDQRENRLALDGMVRGGRGLDLFCYSGAWGLQAVRGGAEVTFIDVSEAALSQAQKNARINGLEERCTFHKEDVFAFLERLVQEGSRYDFIVLDPPAFVKSRGKIKEALRGYREINALAMRLLETGGILATSSCSYHIEKTVFLEMLHNAARDAGKNPRLLEYRSQGKDHPVLLSVPETEYLKCAFIEIEPL